MKSSGHALLRTKMRSNVSVGAIICQKSGWIEIYCQLLKIGAQLVLRFGKFEASNSETLGSLWEHKESSTPPTRKTRRVFHQEIFLLSR